MKLYWLLAMLCPLTSAVETPRPVQVGVHDSQEIDAGINEVEEDPYETVCYDELGCFDKAIGDRLPDDPDEIPPSYIMSSSENPDVRMSWNDTIDDLQNKTDGVFDDQERELIFVAHGFAESFPKAWLLNLRNAALMAYPNASVVIIDWAKAASGPFYFRAASNVPVIANMTVRLTSKLMEISPSIKAENIYFIGFSLGAQMAGYYARSFANLTGTKIGRITSLDAAAPGFQGKGVAPHRGDADFVEAIHTSGGYNIFKGKVGYISPYADIDFYPNGGMNQPGCSFFNIPCSHQRSYIYLIHALENLDSCQFRGIRCETVREANDAKCNGTSVDAYIGQRDLQNYPRLDEDFHIVYMKTESKNPFCSKH